VVVGISGASGAAYAKRLVELLVQSEVETHLIVSPYGQRLLHDELGMEKVDLATLANYPAGSEPPANLIQHSYRDVGAPPASGSFRHDGMVVMPCSSNTLGAIATGNGQNLLHRSAHVALKQRRKLILVHREMPLSLIDIRNMETATEAGAIIAPATPGFYMLPQTMQELIDFVVGRSLDLLEIDHALNIRWGEA
jgi:4-hydroxy-3-polyprenylbenzoate decarboxylase